MGSLQETETVHPPGQPGELRALQLCLRIREDPTPETPAAEPTENPTPAAEPTENPTPAAEPTENTSSWWKLFLDFVIGQIIPPEADALVPVLLQGAFGLLTAIASPFDSIQLLNEGSEQNAIGIEKAFLKLLPTIMITAVFMMVVVYSITLICRSRYRLPTIAVLLLMVFYYFCMLWAILEHLAVSVGAKKIPALQFTLAAALGFSLLSSTVIILFCFLSWLYVREWDSLASN